MEKTHWFCNQKMSWVKVILMAVISAAVTAALKISPVFVNTSFQDIAINLECWILFAVFIIVNCQKWQEAALKTFVFFLISQPLIYLIQVPFTSIGFKIFDYYKYWFIITILTLPGAVIAHQVKRKDWLSMAVLSVANAFLAYMAADYFWRVKAHFPNHLISMCFCIALALFFVFTLLDKKAHRIAAICIIIISLIISLIVLKPLDKETIQLEDGNWTCTVENPSVAEVELDENNTATVTAKNDGLSLVTFINDNGETMEYYITISNGSIYINSMNE